jgi:hypothetical protein
MGGSWQLLPTPPEHPRCNVAVIQYASFYLATFYRCCARVRGTQELGIFWFDEYVAVLQVFVAVFDTVPWTPTVRLPTAAHRLLRLSFQAECHTLLAVTTDGRLIKWRDVAAAAAEHQLPQTRCIGDCSGVFTMSTDWGFIATGSNSGQVALWPLHWTGRRFPLVSNSLRSALCACVLKRPHCCFAVLVGWVHHGR